MLGSPEEGKAECRRVLLVFLLHSVVDAFQKSYEVGSHAVLAENIQKFG
jgi:hypothetical protein